MSDLRITAELALVRADAAIAELFQVSRTQAVSWINDHKVQIRRRHDTDAEFIKKSEKLPIDAMVELTAAKPEETSVPQEDTVPQMPIIYQDEDVIAVAKPVGVAAHPSPGWKGPTVIGALLARGIDISTSGAQERRGIVHRLDVGTSGVMVVAKNEYSYHHLKNAFRDRTPEKTYHCVVQGVPEPTVGTIDAPIGRHPNHDWRFAVIEGARESRTHYRLLHAYGRASLMEVSLETGRTHQIRVHFSALGHPCAGDLTYGADPRLASQLGLTRQWLHAIKLVIAHPRTGQPLLLETGYPDDLSQALDILGPGGHA